MLYPVVYIDPDLHYGRPIAWMRMAEADPNPRGEKPKICIKVAQKLDSKMLYKFMFHLCKMITVKIY